MALISGFSPQKTGSIASSNCDMIRHRFCAPGSCSFFMAASVLLRTLSRNFALIRGKLEKIIPPSAYRPLAADHAPALVDVVIEVKIHERGWSSRGA